MKRKSDYTYEVGNEFVKIIDLNLGNVSVTNNAENVLTEIQSEEDIKGKTIIYRDSENEWCELIPAWEDNTCVHISFRSVLTNYQ